MHVQYYNYVDVMTMTSDVIVAFHNFCTFQLLYDTATSGIKNWCHIEYDKRLNFTCTRT